MNLKIVIFDVRMIPNRMPPIVLMMIVKHAINNVCSSPFSNCGSDSISRLMPELPITISPF